MINGLQWSRGSFGGGGGPVCPSMPFDPSTLALSYWLDGDQCPGTAVPWLGKASAGTSGSLSADQYFGSIGPQGLAHVPSVSPCGVGMAQFRASPYAVSGTAYAGGGTDIIPGTDGTVVAAFQYVLGRTSGVAPQYDSAIVEAFHDQWRVQMNAGGYAQVSCTTSAGVQVATTANNVAPGDYAIVVAQFTPTEVRVRLNRGAWSVIPYPRSVVAQNLLLLGFQGTFGEILDMNLSTIQIANSVLSPSDVSGLELYGEWRINTTV